jgi:hypothetical protein
MLYVKWIFRDAATKRFSEVRPNLLSLEKFPSAERNGGVIG